MRSSSFDIRARLVSPAPWLQFLAQTTSSGWARAPWLEYRKLNLAVSATSRVRRRLAIGCPLRENVFAMPPHDELGNLSASEARIWAGRNLGPAAPARAGWRVCRAHGERLDSAALGAGHAPSRSAPRREYGLGAVRVQKRHSRIRRNAAIALIGLVISFALLNLQFLHSDLPGLRPRRSASRA